MTSGVIRITAGFPSTSPLASLPDELVGTVFFEPGVNGYENTIRKYLDFCRRLEDGSAKK